MVDKEAWKKDRIQSAANGTNPMVIAKMKSGYAAIGDTQFLPGYCVLLPFHPYRSLEDMPVSERKDYLFDMSLIGDAVQDVCEPRRLNYSIYGNSDPFLHAHIFPRYDWEPEERMAYPVWQYPEVKWKSERYQYTDEWHGKMRERIGRKIVELMEEAYLSQNIQK